MAKEKVKHLSGVFASVFAHAGHISKEDAKEISGLEDHEFEKAYDKASNIADSVMQHEREKMDKLSTAFAEKQMLVLKIAGTYDSKRDLLAMKNSHGLSGGFAQT